MASMVAFSRSTWPWMRGSILAALTTKLALAVAVKDGRVQKEELPVETPAGMSALVFNTRRPLFADPRVREAMIKLFDFAWINRTLFHGQYARTQSYFAKSYGIEGDVYELTVGAESPL